MKNKKIIILIILSILLILNTILVLCGLTDSIDEIVHNSVLFLYSETSTKIMKNITFFGCTKFIVGLCLILFIYYFYRKKKTTAFSISGILVLSTIVNNVVKIIIRRPRPEYITIVENTFSYPSGHMMASATLYGFIIFIILKSDIEKKYKAFFSTMMSLLILLIGLSRIYLGAHFFTDVFGAALISCILIISYSLLIDKKVIHI